MSQQNKSIMRRAYFPPLIILIIAGFTAAAGLFASAQSIWIDETTQLSGLGLGLGEQLRWLLGQSDVVLGVPLDRMPPLSYWLGGVWAGVFGLSEAAMRWFGIATILCAAPALFLAGRRAGGWAGGLFCLAFVLLSPNLIVQSVEIRAYPLFLAFCTWGLWCFTLLVIPEEDDAVSGDWTPGQWRLLVLLGVFVVAAVYAHFYGLIFAFCLLVSLILDTLLRRRALWPILAVAGVACLLCLGIVPFTLAAMGISSAGAPAPATSMTETILQAAKLVFRLVAHGSHLVYPLALAVLGLGLLALALLNLTGRAAAAGTWRRLLVMLTPLLIAFPLLAVLNLKVGTFNVLAPHYNLWMVPLVAIWLCLAYRAQSSPMRKKLLLGASTLAVAGQLMADAVLLRAPGYFTHGPGEWVAGFIEDPQNTLVVHDEMGSWSQVYFPVTFLTAGAATQVLISPTGALTEVSPAGRQAITGDPAEYLLRFPTVLRVSVRDHNSSALAAAIRSGTTCNGGQVPGLGPEDVEVPSESYCAFAAATLSVSRK